VKVDIALPNTKLDFLTYDTDFKLQVGDLVAVPLRNKIQPGIVVQVGTPRDVGYLKPVKELIAPAFVAPTLLKLYRWLAEYYLSSLGDVLRLAFPADILKKEKGTTGDAIPVVLAPAPELTAAQNQAVNLIARALNRDEFKTFLVHGITSSGKTEIYMRGLQEVIRRGGRGLVLVPEISMTPLLLQRLRERFGEAVAVIHSALSARERRAAWSDIKNGRYRIVVGPRSAIFLPIPGLKLIVIDEEHDPSYKEHQQALKYNARDAAVMRGKIEKMVVVLGSATPQVESYHNAVIGKYELIALRERIDHRPLPEADIVDLKEQSRRFITGKLEKALEETLTAGGQAIIYLNRRGFAPAMICPNCGFTASCPFCKLPLVYHKAGKGPSFLACHVCDHKAKFYTVCPKCGRSTLLYHGAGTQRVEEMLKRIVERLPVPAGGDKDGLVVRLDRDAARKRGETEKIFERFASGAAKILLGTQLVTKGLDFPGVTLVGIVNADIVFNLPDFRSGERTFQVLTQVAGRSGRGEQKGRVLIQTFHPDQYAIIFGRLQDYAEFYKQEIKMRQELALPPFTRLILLRFSGKNEALVKAEAERIYGIVAKIRKVKAYGPNPSFYYKVRRNYRFYILVKTGLDFPRSRLGFLKEIRPKSVKFEIDVDPMEVF
jgi:primosomal protein N' (replication factor Y)